MPIFCSHRRSQYLNFTKKVVFWDLGDFHLVDLIIMKLKHHMTCSSALIGGKCIQLVCCFVIHWKKCKMSKFPSHRGKAEETWAVSVYFFLIWTYPRLLNENFKKRIQILKELGNDVIVEEQSDNFGQSSKGQASQTEAQRRTSGFGRLCRKIQ